MSDSYSAFLDEAIRRFRQASGRLDDRWLDVDLGNGLMTARALVQHCYLVLGFVHERLDLPYAPPPLDLEPPALYDEFIVRLEALKEQVGDDGPANRDPMVFRPIADILHHSGQLAIWPRLVAGAG